MYYLFFKMCRHMFSRGGAVVNSGQSGPLTLTFMFSSTLAAHAQRVQSPAGRVQGSRAQGTWMSGQKLFGYITAT